MVTHGQEAPPCNKSPAKERGCALFTAGFLGQKTMAGGKLLCAVPHKPLRLLKGRASQANLQRRKASNQPWRVLKEKSDLACVPAPAAGWWPGPSGAAAAIGNAG